MPGAVLPVLVLVAFAAGCSSSGGKDDQVLTEQRENYCTQLGQWQRVRNEAATGTPESSGYDEVGGIAENAFLAARPLRNENVGGGRTLAEATGAAMSNGESGAEALIAGYCESNGFETLMR